MTLQDFAVGDILLITGATQAGEDKRIALVTMINHNNNGLVTIGPYFYTGADRHKFGPCLTSGQGAFDPAEVGSKPFGFYKRVEKIGFDGGRHQPQTNVLEHHIPETCYD